MMKTQRSAYTLFECVVLVLVLGLLACIALPMLGAARYKMRGMSSAQKLMNIGHAGMMYAGDHGDRLFSYSWRAGESYVLPSGQIRNPSSDQVAAADQNQEILMRRTGRISGAYKIQNATSRIPHRRYTHLVLMDYLDMAFPSDLFIDPSDANQQVWSANPLEYGSGSGVPYANGSPVGYDDDPNWSNLPVRQRWAFGSSYQVVPDAWQPDRGLRYIPVQDTPHLFSSSGPVPLANGRKMTDVLFNGNKVWMYEEFDRDRANPLYFGYDDAQSEKLMFDGSVNNWASGNAAPSMVPEQVYGRWCQTYVPLDTFPLPNGGLGDTRKVSQRYRWTFNGLAGINYGPFSWNGTISGCE
ncbi:MAG: hypothetical protein ACF8K1_11855 [Phycisphaerales bacterium JB047]